MVSKCNNNFKIKDVIKDFWKFWQEIFKLKQMEKLIDKNEPLPYMNGTAKNIIYEFNEEWEEELFSMLFDTMK